MTVLHRRKVDIFYTAAKSPDCYQQYRDPCHRPAHPWYPSAHMTPSTFIWSAPSPLRINIMHIVHIKFGQICFTEFLLFAISIACAVQGHGVSKNWHQIAWTMWSICSTVNSVERCNEFQQSRECDLTVQFSPIYMCAYINENSRIKVEWRTICLLINTPDKCAHSQQRRYLFYIKRKIG